MIQVRDAGDAQRATLLQFAQQEQERDGISATRQTDDDPTARRQHVESLHRRQDAGREGHRVNWVIAESGNRVIG